MREAYANVKGAKEGEINYFYLEGCNRLYVGIEYTLENDSIVTWYFSPIDESEAFVCLYCGEDTFDDLLENLNRVNSNAIKKAWPHLISALLNGVADNYSSPALIKLGSTERAERTFWCLAMKVENFDLSEPDNLIGNYAMGKVKTLLDHYIEMFREMKENEPGTFDLVVGGVKEGIRWGRALKIASGIGGMLLGIPPLFGGDGEV